MCKVLNEMGIKPVIFSFSHEDAVKAFSSEYFSGKRVFEHRRLFLLPFARGYSYQVVLSNLLFKPKACTFALIINSNSCLCFSSGRRSLFYIHFPLEAEWAYNVRFKDLLHKLYIAPIKVIARLFTPPISRLKEVTLVANSEFTRKVTSQTFCVPEEKIEVLYPPAYDESLARGGQWGDTKDIDVISVGAFSPDKMQLEQLQIAKEIPQLKFGIVGRIHSSSYFRKCEEYIRKNGLKNVRLYSNARRETLKGLLQNARFFLHSRRFEHFGIATVEAIAAGCIPVVHDSGGQREIVPLSELRYSTKEEAISILEKLNKLDNKEREKLIKILNDHAQKNFSIQTFRRRFKDICQKLL